jgi:hypothetical protein
MPKLAKTKSACRCALARLCRCANTIHPGINALSSDDLLMTSTGQPKLTCGISAPGEMKKAFNSAKNALNAVMRRSRGALRPRVLSGESETATNSRPTSAAALALVEK